FEPNEEGFGFQDELMYSDGSGRDCLKIEAGGSLFPASQETVAQGRHYVTQDGKTVFKKAVSKMSEVSKQLMEQNGLSSTQLDWLVPHQANKRIIDSTAKQLNLDESKVLINIQKYGN